MHKRWVKIVLGIVAAFILLLIIVPLFVNADTFRPTVQDQLSSLLGRRVTLGHLSFSLFSGSLVAENISIADDPAFSTAPFVTANKLKIGVEVGPLLFSRQVRITNFNVDSPGIQLIQNHAGKWNFSSIGGSAAKPTSAQKPSSIPDLTVGQLSISNGSVTVSSVPATGKPFVYSGVDIGVKQFSFAKSFPFDLSANLPAGGTLKLTGNAGPLAEKDAADTPFQAGLQIRHLDPVAAGLIDASKGISMVADIDSKISSNGTTAESNGKIRTAKLQLARAGSPAAQPVDIDYQVSDDLEARTGRISDIAVHTGNVAAHVTGTFRSTPQAPVLDLHLAAPNLPIDQLEQLLPVVGIKLPTGSSLHGGTLSANLAITGPATETTISGPVDMENTNLAGFDLGSKIEGINPFGGTGNGTQIQSVKATLNSSPNMTQINDIYGNAPAIGSATGSGTVSPSGALNFNLVAKLSSSNVVGATMNSAINSAVNSANNAVGGLIGGLFGKKSQGANPATGAASHGIPITITGTAEHPSIRANIGAMLR
jgi:AsmA protein